jgi:hypothetical protein
MDTEEIAKISIARFAEQLGKAEAVLFWQHLDGNPSAKQMLAGLYQAGSDPLTLMTLAVLYCKGEELGVKEVTKRATGYSSQQLASFSQRLLQAAKDIQALNEASMPGGVTLWKLIRVLSGGELLEKTLAPVLPSEQLDFEFTRLPVILAAYSVFLKSWPHPTYRALISERNLGRKFFLTEFVVYVETILGHANWNAIAAAIAAVHFALGEPRGVSTEVENLRSAVEEFQTQNARIFGDIRKWAETAAGARARNTAETSRGAAEA